MRDRRPALVDTARERWGELLAFRCADPAAIESLFGELLQRLEASDRWRTNLRRLLDALAWIERLEHRAHDPHAVRLTAWAASTWDISAGGTAAGDTAVGDTAAGDTVVGDTAVGDTAVGDTAVGDTAVGDTAVGDTAAGDTAAGVDGVRSALRRLGRVGVQPATLTGVERLLSVLPEHDPDHGDADAEVLCDAYWAVLGAPATEYRDHVDELRHASALPEAAWHGRRLRTVHELLGRDSVFHTPEMRAAREGRAQLNIAREAADLRAAGHRRTSGDTG